MKRKVIISVLSTVLVLILAISLLTACNPKDEKTTFKVTYELGEYIGDGAAPQGAEVESEVTLPEVGVEWDGHTFAGWKAGEGEVHQPGETVEVTEDVTFTAQWDLNVYTVTYKPGDGTGENVVAQLAEGNITLADSKFTVPVANEIGEDDPYYYYQPYAFLGWTIEGDASGRVYLPGETYALGAGVTFVAKYVEGFVAKASDGVAKLVVEVEYDCEAGSMTGIKSATVYDVASVVSFAHIELDLEGYGELGYLPVKLAVDEEPEADDIFTLYVSPNDVDNTVVDGEDTREEVTVGLVLHYLKAAVNAKNYTFGGRVNVVAYAEDVEGETLFNEYIALNGESTVTFPTAAEISELCGVDFDENKINLYAYVVVDAQEEPIAAYEPGAEFDFSSNDSPVIFVYPVIEASSNIVISMYDSSYSYPDDDNYMVLNDDGTGVLVHKYVDYSLGESYSEASTQSENAFTYTMTAAATPEDENVFTITIGGKTYTGTYVVAHYDFENLEFVPFDVNVKIVAELEADNYSGDHAEKEPTKVKFGTGELEHFTVHFDIGDVEMYNPSVFADRLVEYYSKEFLPDVSSQIDQDGVEFLYWTVKEGDQSVHYEAFDEYLVTEDVTFVAIYHFLEEYTVHYDVGGYTGSKPHEDQHCFEGHTVGTLSEYQLDDYDHFILTGWRSEEGDTIPPGHSYTPTKKESTLTAIWTPAFHINYWVNGEINLENKLTADEVVADEGPGITYSTPHGTNFVGWFEADQSGNKTGAQPLGENEKASKDMNVVAVFEAFATKVQSIDDTSFYGEYVYSEGSNIFYAKISTEGVELSRGYMSYAPTEIFKLNEGNGINASSGYVLYDDNTAIHIFRYINVAALVEQALSKQTWEVYGGVRDGGFDFTFKDGKCTVKNDGECNDTVSYTISYDGKVTMENVNWGMDSPTSSVQVTVTFEGTTATIKIVSEDLKLTTQNTFTTTVTLPEVDGTVLNIAVDSDMNKPGETYHKIDAEFKTLNIYGREDIYMGSESVYAVSVDVKGEPELIHLIFDDWYGDPDSMLAVPTADGEYYKITLGSSYKTDYYFKLHANGTILRMYTLNNNSYEEWATFVADGVETVELEAALAGEWGTLNSEGYTLAFGFDGMGNAIVRYGQSVQDYPTTYTLDKEGNISLSADVYGNSSPQTFNLKLTVTDETTTLTVLSEAGYSGALTRSGDFISAAAKAQLKYKGTWESQDGRDYTFKLQLLLDGEGNGVLRVLSGDVALQTRQAFTYRLVENGGSYDIEFTLKEGKVTGTNNNKITLTLPGEIGEHIFTQTSEELQETVSPYEEALLNSQKEDWQYDDGEGTRWTFVFDGSQVSITAYAYSRYEGYDATGTIPYVVNADGTVTLNGKFYIDYENEDVEITISIVGKEATVSISISYYCNTSFTTTITQEVEPEEESDPFQDAIKGDWTMSDGDNNWSFSFDGVGSVTFSAKGYDYDAQDITATYTIDESGNVTFGNFVIGDRDDLEITGTITAEGELNLKFSSGGTYKCTKA